MLLAPLERWSIMNQLRQVCFISDGDIQVDVIRTPEGDRCHIRHLPRGFERRCGLGEQHEALAQLEAQVLMHVVEDSSAAAKISPAASRALMTLRERDDEGLRGWLAAARASREVGGVKVRVGAGGRGS